ncbi:MAG: AAA family ATPase [Pseudomonadota bacterium]
MNARLARIHFSGFRSLKDVSLDLGAVSVLIGPNGAGKSNLLWALEMTRMLAFEALQLFVNERGGATYLMHYGPKETPAIDILLEFDTDSGQNAYQASLGYGSDESLVFLSERAGFRQRTDLEWRWSELGAGHRESMLKVAATENDDDTARTVRWLLRQINFYHFHDTSRRSPLRTRSYADTSGEYLRSDGSNLPVFLLGLRESDDQAAKASWRRILGVTRRIAPFVADILPVQDRRGIKLEWVDERGATFGPAHLSDGTLRALALITALGQPEAEMPLVSCIDEPELGLHPAALAILCSLISSASTRRQIIVSTQSPVILDCFEPKHVVVAQREDQATRLRRLDEKQLSSWLEEYTLSQLYDKNVIGGRP